MTIDDFLKLKHPRARKLMRRLRISILFNPRRTILLSLITLIMVYILYQFLSFQTFADHDHFDSNKEHLVNRCEPLSPMAQNVLKVFVKRILNTFEMLEVTHFLCYETLWAAMKRSNQDAKKASQLRITDACFNLCILNEDLIKHDEAIIERRFRNNGITVQYIHSDGIYILKPNTKLMENNHNNDNDKDKNDDQPPYDDEDLHPILFTIHARIHVFEKDAQLDVYRRIGWRSRILPSTMCKQLHCFPTSLINDRSKMPKLKLIPSLPSINVPNEGLEIQKYHYPDTWWMMASESQDEPGECP